MYHQSHPENKEGCEGIYPERHIPTCIISLTDESSGCQETQEGQ